MFRYGWLTVTAEDLAIWRQFPDAAFTLVKLPSDPDAPEEFHLGAFEYGPSSSDARRALDAPRLLFRLQVGLRRRRVDGARRRGARRENRGLCARPRLPRPATTDGRSRWL